jgi:hypothetical protein
MTNGVETLRVTATLPLHAAPTTRSAAAYLLAVRPLAFFRPSEEVNDVQVEALMAHVQRDGIWTAPLPVEMASGLVMDGNHRLRAAQRLGLKRLPCVPLSYDDPRVAVSCWKTGRAYCADEVRQLGRGEVVLPYKTTRHRFNPPLPGTEIPIKLLL